MKHNSWQRKDYLSAAISSGDHIGSGPCFENVNSVCCTKKNQSCRLRQTLCVCWGRTEVSQAHFRWFPATENLVLTMCLKLLNDEKFFWCRFLRSGRIILWWFPLSCRFLATTFEFKCISFDCLSVSYFRLDEIFDSVMVLKFCQFHSSHFWLA